MFNLLDLCSDVCLLSLNPVQSFKVKCLTCDISTDTSTKKRFTHTHALDGQFLLII